MAWHPPNAVGDIDPLIPAAKTYLRRFSYGKAEGLGLTDVSDVYTAGFGRALVTFKTRVRDDVNAGKRPGPLTDTDSEFDWAAKVQMGLVGLPDVAPKLKPLFISVEGHMSDMFIGPAVGIGQQLEREGLVQLQPTGYNNTALPFDDQSGIDAVAAHFRNPALMPKGRKWCDASFSQGEIVMAEFLMQYVFPDNGEFHDRMGDWICSLHLGAPYREKDKFAEWIPDPPKPGTQGISPRRLSGDYGGRIKYQVRHGDLYTENEDSHVGEIKTTIYDIAANSDPSAFFNELLLVGINPTQEIWDIAQAIWSGVLFLADMSPHGGYDLGPPTDWMRGKIRAATASAVAA